MKQVELMSLVKLTFRAVFRHDDQINSCLLLNEEILEPIRRSRNVSVVYNPFLSVRIAPVYACILKPLAAGDDLRIYNILQINSRKGDSDHHAVFC